MTDESHSLKTYVSDAIALERHIRIPFEMQSNDEDFSNYDAAGRLVQRLASASGEHIRTLENLLETLGGHAATPVKSAVSQFEGFFAGAIDKMRKTKVSKALRDDYTALALCTAAYTMLETTALALQSQTVADIAQRHLEEYAQLVMEIGDALPGVVLDELQTTGLTVDTNMAEPARRAMERAWRGDPERSTMGA